MNKGKAYITTLSLMTALGLFFSIKPVATVSAAEEAFPVNVYFFSAPGCGHCAAEKSYLDEQTALRDNLTVVEYGIDEPDHLTMLGDIAAIFSEETVATPFTVIGGKHYVGFNAAVELSLTRAIERYSANAHVDIMAKYLADEPILATDFDTTSDFEYDLPLIGIVDVRDVSLGIVAVILGFIDGINPCAMWVLLFLISLVLGSKDKKRIWLIGGLFLLTSGAFYFLIMMAWLKTIELLIAQTVFQIIIGALALLAGAYNIYSFVKARVKKEDGCEVTNVTQKQNIAAKVRQIANAGSLPVALIGVMGLAVIVNAVELACSTGLPLVFTQILAVNGIVGAASIFYVLLYILFFMLDDLLIFGIAVFTLKVSPLASKLGRYAHLIGGILMLAIGILMIFFPEILLFSFL